MTDDFHKDLTRRIKSWGLELGFQQTGIAGTDLSSYETHLTRFLDAGRHGEMDYLRRHGLMRCRPAELVEGTRTVITVRMNYRPASADPVAVLASDRTAYVSRYALGRDYHKVMRARLVKLWNRVADFLRAAGIDDARGRVFTDSAPVMEKALAEQSGIGWIGKNTLLLTRDAGSWFFLGEIFTNLPLAVDAPMETEHCGSCDACITACPTGAIVAPYELDAKKCISYLTIEKRGSIPVALREAIGNRIFGCDDCQLVCPWNKFARPTRESDFSPRHGLDNTGLVELFLWTEDEFLARTEGSAIRRAGYEGWLRNLAVALGNGPASKEAKSALLSRRNGASEMVAEHIDWALEQLERRGVAG